MQLNGRLDWRGRVRLFQHPDFGQAILRAAEHFAARMLRPAVIEKDYYVTEALRIIAEREGDRAIFKGGTSLSKGWGLIERFSEDIDVFIDICGDDPMPGTKSIDTRLRAIRNAIDQHPGLAFSKDQSTTSKGLKRADRFLYDERIPEIGGLSPGVLVETMVASGKAPTERRQIASFVGEFLRETGTTLGCDDEQPFEMLLLHFRRTFVEKLFAIHAKVEILKQTGEPLGSYARHYYDLYCLAERPEVLAMLRSDEYAAIKADYARISEAFYARDFIPPSGMNFQSSDALFPDQALEQVLARNYEEQSSLLCYGDAPGWKDIKGRLSQLRPLL
jgi:hypothetical protein